MGLRAPAAWQSRGVFHNIISLLTRKTLRFYLDSSHRDETLFNNSLQQKHIELEKTLAVKERKLDSVKKSAESISSRKTQELDNCKRKL